jgi:hypothetical protein
MYPITSMHLRIRNTYEHHATLQQGDKRILALNAALKRRTIAVAQAADAMKGTDQGVSLAACDTCGEGDVASPTTTSLVPGDTVQTDTKPALAKTGAA